MVVCQVSIKIRLLLATFLFVCIYGKVSRPNFIVIFPAEIESGSNAKFCVSVLNPEDTLHMNIYLVDNNQSRTLLQETVQKEIHHCSHFKAPQVEHDLVQEIKVEVKGESFKMTEKRKVMFKSYRTLVFIQTDKPIYNPRQTVNFRIVSMDSNFIPVEQQYNLVSLQDSYHNRIGQWTNVSSTGGILQLAHELNAEAPHGHYWITVGTENRLITHEFVVKEYVLPKFEVTVIAPDEHSVTEEELSLTVCGMYTYGQPVPGQVVVQLCRKVTKNIQSSVSLFCLSETVTIGQSGCALVNLTLTPLMNVKSEQYFKNELIAGITLTEEGTFTSLKKWKIIKLYKMGQVEIIDSPKMAERGKPIEGKVKVSTFRGNPIPNKKVYLFAEQWFQNVTLNLTTDCNGLANFSITAPENLPDKIILKASIDPEIKYSGKKKTFFSDAYLHIQLLQPVKHHKPKFSSLSIESPKQPFKCGAEVPITINYNIAGKTKRSYSADLMYGVLSKGRIVHYGHDKLEVKASSDGTNGTISMNLSVSAELAPVIQVMAYAVLPQKQIITETENFEVEKCFSNEVSLKFSASSVVPGEEHTLELSADPGSLCGLSVVDKSVFILESEDQLNIDKIFKLLPATRRYYPSVLDDYVGCLEVRPRRYLREHEHVYNPLKEVGLKMATNLIVTRPTCLIYEGVKYFIPGHFGAHGENVLDTMIRWENDDYLPLGPIKKVHEFFPETWIWQLVEIGKSGSVRLPVTVPDTITTWKTEVFCMSSRGLGLAPSVQITAFQPFFLELFLPYSIIQGEVFELKATVFNYLSKCIMVKVTASPSSEYTLEPSSDSEYSSCLCANGRKTFNWTLIPTALGVVNVTVSAEAEQSQTVCDNEIVSVPERGRIDTVTRSLVVKAKGTEKVKTQSWLLCPHDNGVSEELELVVPEDVIEESLHASVSVLGDILGRALKNLDGLLKMPDGCGEYNIAILAPSVYILQYLEHTKQLTTAIHQRATDILKRGYQRQLKFAHFDGAYSTFGAGSNDEKNTWLTAFVFGTFGKAQHYIFIAPENIKSAKQWLISTQRSDGCFTQQGGLINNRIKGGVNDDVTITAYILVSFLELGITVQDPVVNKGMTCLKSSVGNLTNNYAAALLAYTFSLAGENETREHLLKELNRVAITKDGWLYWSQSISDDASVLSVEISSYVLLAVLSTSHITAADLGYAYRIAGWLVKQQNPSGGFSSTQDTVVALKALALYSTKVFSSDGASTVTVRSGQDEHSHTFEVNQNNKLLYQERSLQNVPGKYSIKVKGSTCVSVQATLFYNIPTPPRSTTLNIMATAEGDCSKPFGHFLDLNIAITYNGSLDSTNLIIVDIKLLSGFTVDPEQLQYAFFNAQAVPFDYSPIKISSKLLVQHVDSKDDHIIMFIKKLQRNIPVNYSLYIEQVIPVKNLKPAVIKVYDYYHTNDQSEVEYTSPCV